MMTGRENSALLPLISDPTFHRYAVENHIHRNPRLGLSVMINETWYNAEKACRLKFPCPDGAVGVA
jgi:hypothetical protein